MLWAMLGTLAAVWVVFAALFVVASVLWRRRKRRKGAAGNPPGAFSRLHNPAPRPQGINPKTGAPF